MFRKFQNILYVSRGTTDETESARQALGLARHESAELHTLVVGPTLPGDLAFYDSNYRASLSQRAETSLANAGVALRMDPEAVSFTPEVELGKPQAEHIVRRVLRNAHDLVIKQASSGANSEEDRALDFQLLRLCPCPVWLSRPIARAPADIRVGVAVDPQSLERAGGDLARRLLQVARALSDALSGELHVISTWSYELESTLRMSPLLKVADDLVDRAVATADRDHRKALDVRIGESGIDGRIRIHRARGSAVQVIPKLIDELQIDILVIGTLARSGLSRFVIGNTAESVLQDVQCSLVAIKPHGFASPVRAY
jgi:nucleotide-binding universal stress UspA family protein